MRPCPAGRICARASRNPESADGVRSFLRDLELDLPARDADSGESACRDTASASAAAAVEHQRDSFSDGPGELSAAAAFRRVRVVVSGRSAEAFAADL